MRRRVLSRGASTPFHILPFWLMAFWGVLSGDLYADRINYFPRDPSACEEELGLAGLPRVESTQGPISIAIADTTPLAPGSSYGGTEGPTAIAAIGRNGHQWILAAGRSKLRVHSAQELVADFDAIHVPGETPGPELFATGTIYHPDDEVAGRASGGTGFLEPPSPQKVRFENWSPERDYLITMGGTTAPLLFQIRSRLGQAPLNAPIRVTSLKGLTRSDAETETALTAGFERTSDSLVLVGNQGHVAFSSLRWSPSTGRHRLTSMGRYRTTNQELSAATIVIQPEAPDESQVWGALSDSGRVGAWSLSSTQATGRSLKRLYLGPKGSPVTFVKALTTFGNSHVLVARDTGWVELYDPKKPQQRPIVLEGHENRVIDAHAWGPFIVTQSATPEGAIKVWQTNGTLLWTLLSARAPSALGLDAAMACAISPEGFLGVATRQGRVLLWNLADGSLIARFQPRGKALSLAFSDEGESLFVGLESGTIREHVIREER